MTEGVWIASKMIFTRKCFWVPMFKWKHRNAELEIFISPLQKRVNLHWSISIPRRIDRDLGFNLDQFGTQFGSLHHLHVHHALENPETMNRPSVEFPKQRASQDTNTIFSVHVVSLPEVATNIFFLFHRIFSPSQVRSDSYFSLTKSNYAGELVNKNWRSWLFIKNWPVVGGSDSGIRGIDGNTMDKAIRFCPRDENSVPREALPPHLGMQRKLLKTSWEASKRHRTEDTLRLWKEIIHVRKTWIYKTVWLWPFSSTPQKLPGKVCTQSGHSFNASDFSSAQNTRKKTRTEVTQFVVSHDDLEVRNPGMQILSCIILELESTRL